MLVVPQYLLKWLALNEPRAHNCSRSFSECELPVDAPNILIAGANVLLLRRCGLAHAVCTGKSQGKPKVLGDVSLSRV